MKLDKELVNTYSLSERPKTTCELYHAAITLELLPSVQSSVYTYLHFPPNKAGQNLFKNSNQKRLKELIKNIYASLELTYKYKLAPNEKCDIIFNFISHQINYLGIQKILAKQCLSQGLSTGIIHGGEIENSANFNENYSSSLKFSISPSKKKEIVEQCKYMIARLNNFNVGSFAEETGYLKLVNTATHIEQKAIWMRHLLEVKRPKLVILTNEKDLNDTAMQIACKDTGTLSVLIPHGFPQRSQYPIAASFVMSYCLHHDSYLKKLSLTSDRVKELGWLEPTVTLDDSFKAFSKKNATVEQREKYNILFLSQFTGCDVHRCTSLIERFPNILRALDKMDRVETVTLRLRPNEVNNIFIKAFLAECGCSKLRVSSAHESLAENLKASNIVMAFSSTGLLYGPYLNMKAIEIRDEAINAVWGGTVLPPEQVYQIGDNFKANEFNEFVAESPTLNGEDVFYNWNCELEGFAEFLNTII